MIYTINTQLVCQKILQTTNFKTSSSFCDYQLEKNPPKSKKSRLFSTVPLPVIPEDLTSASSAFVLTLQETNPEFALLLSFTF